MGDWQKNGNWVPPALVMAFGVLWFIFASRQSLLCADDEPGLVCLREWLSSTSGYLATIAAAVTIYFLYKQNAEQKKQTDFLLGNARPTIDAIRHQKSPASVVIRIVNWNRRPILVSHLSLLGVASLAKIHLGDVTLYSRESGGNLVAREVENGTVLPAVAMHGWKNRSKAPCEVRIDILVEQIDGSYLLNWSGVTAQVGVVMAGEEQGYLTLKSPVAVAD